MQLEFGLDTLSIERDRITQHREEGTHCLACGQFAKVYPRSIHSTIARTMIGLARKFGTGWFHILEVDKYTNARGDFHKIAFWDFLEPMPADQPPTNGARSHGMWRFTDNALRFVRREIKVPRVAFVYNDTLLAMSPELCDIVDCLNKKFDYFELMNS